MRLPDELTPPPLGVGQMVHGRTLRAACGHGENCPLHFPVLLLFSVVCFFVLTLSLA